MHGSDNAARRMGMSRRLIVALVLALALLVVLPAVAFADTHTWTGIMPGAFWNNALNWSPAIVPTDGDNLVFPDVGVQTATNDAYLLNSVGSVDLNGPITIDSDRAITLTGSMSAHESPTWDVTETNIGSNLTISEAPAADSPDVFTVLGAISMNPEGSGGHGLTVNVAAPGSMIIDGQISGNPTTCSLTKTGDGELSLSHQAGNTWGGTTSVQGGTLKLATTGALSQTTGVNISAGATVKADFLVHDTWHNTFTGSGDLNVEADSLSLAGSSPGFAGTTNVQGGGNLSAEGIQGGLTDVSSGELRGAGSVGDLHVHDAGKLSPGSEVVPVGQLTATGGAQLQGGGTFIVDVTNAGGAPGSGFDALRVTGGNALDVSADYWYPFTIVLRSEAVVVGFDNTKSYRWQIASTTGAVTNFHRSSFVVNTDYLGVDLGDGEFTVQSTGSTIDLVFGRRARWTITPTAGLHGSISPSAPQYVSTGGSQGFTMGPDPGYHVADVLVDGSSVGAVTSYTFDNVTVNHTISVTFAINTYTITPSAGANGSISPTGVQTVNYGGSQSFTITPNTGYHVVDVIAGGTSVGAVTSYTFSDVTGNQTISASFAINTYTITPSAGANGSISPAGVQTVNYGGSQSFTITPSTGYHVVDVLVNGSSVGAVASYMFSDVTGNQTISATFAGNNYTITPSAGANGSISPAGVQTVNYGGSQSFTITPAAHYHVASVLVDGSSVGAVTSYTFSSVGANHTISATFAIDTYTITPSAGANGSISPAGVQTVNYGGSQSFTITPAAHYHVASVLVDGSSVGAVTSYTFSSVGANHTISATFAIDTYTITPSAGANGSISPAGVQTVNYGGSQSFTITPSSGYHVADVLVNGSSVGAVTGYTFSNVTGNQTISATFAINSYTITPSAGVNGTISPASVQTVTYGGSRSFTMTPAAGYHVLGVLVDGTAVGSVTSYSFSDVSASHTIAVTFEASGALTTTSPNGGESWAGGSVHNVTWTMSPAASSGYFRVLYYNPTLGVYQYANSNVPVVAGQSSYSSPWTITQPAGTDWYVRVYYFSAGGTEIARDTSDGPFAVTSPPTVAVTSPNGGESWVGGSVHNVTWTMSPAASSGYFRVLYYNPTLDFYQYASTNVPVVAGQSSYSSPWTITQPAGTDWYVRVYYFSAGGTEIARDASNAAFALTPAQTLAVTSPNGGESWAGGSVHNVTWTMSPAASSGYFRVLYYNPTLGVYQYANSNVPVVAGQSSYSSPWTITQAEGTDWYVRVYYFSAGGAEIARDTSDGPITITPTPTLTSPNGGESWAGGSVHNVTWTMSPAASSGYFRVLYYNPTLGVYQYANSNVPVVAGQSSYSSPWTITQPAGTDWYVRVYYFSAGGTEIARDTSDGPFAVTSPPTVAVTSPNGGESWVGGSVHNVTWTMSPAASSGYFRVLYYNPTLDFYQYASTNVPVVAGQSSYSSPWTITQPAGTDWYVRVYYFSAGGTEIARDASNAAFALTPAQTLAVTSPNGGESWAGGSVHNVTWTMSPAASSGYFRVLYYNPTLGVYQYANSNVPVVAGQSSYSSPWTITQAEGTDWYVRVYYFSAGGAEIARDTSDGPMSILAL